jgi:hypothetical protein
MTIDNRFFIDPHERSPEYMIILIGVVQGLSVIRGLLCCPMASPKEIDTVRKHLLHVPMVVLKHYQKRMVGGSDESGPKRERGNERL